MKSDCYYYQASIKKNVASFSNSIQHIEPNNHEQGKFAFMLSYSNITNQCLNNEIAFLLDSGATDHITNQYDIFKSYNAFFVPLKIADAKNYTCVEAFGKGRVNVQCNTTTICIQLFFNLAKLKHYRI